MKHLTDEEQKWLDLAEAETRTLHRLSEARGTTAVVRKEVQAMTEIVTTRLQQAPNDDYLRQAYTIGCGILALLDAHDIGEGG